MKVAQIILFLFFLTSDVFAFSSEKFGLGLAVGEPGGVTAFLRTNDRSFVQAFLGPNLVVGGDYNFAFTRLVPSSPNITPYLGFGGFLFAGRTWTYSRGTTGFGIRMPVGLLIKVPEAPFHFHLEIAPSTTINPFMDSFAAFLAGVRFLF